MDSIHNTQASNVAKKGILKNKPKDPSLEEDLTDSHRYIILHVGKVNY
jgi:hypothetical protein